MFSGNVSSDDRGVADEGKFGELSLLILEALFTSLVSTICADLVLVFLKLKIFFRNDSEKFKSFSKIIYIIVILHFR